MLWVSYFFISYLWRIVIFNQIHTIILYLPIPIDASQQMKMTIYALSVLSLCSEYLIGCVTARKLKMYEMKSWILSSTFKFISHIEKFFEQSNMFMHSKSNHWKIFAYSAYLACCFSGSFEIVRRVYSCLTMTYRSMLMATRLNIDEVLQMTSREM